MEYLREGDEVEASGGLEAKPNGSIQITKANNTVSKGIIPFRPLRKNAVRSVKRQDCWISPVLPNLILKGRMPKRS